MIERREKEGKLLTVRGGVAGHSDFESESSTSSNACFNVWVEAEYWETWERDSLASLVDLHILHSGSCLSPESQSSFNSSDAFTIFSKAFLSTFFSTITATTQSCNTMFLFRTDWFSSIKFPIFIITLSMHSFLDFLLSTL